MKTRGELEQFSWELTKGTLKQGKHVYYNPRQQLYNIDDTINDSTHASPLPTLICNEHSNTIFMTMIIYRFTHYKTTEKNLSSYLRQKI